jgi:putative endonuclease
MANQQKRGYVYIMTNPRRTVLYTGVTTQIIPRIWRHKQRDDGFSAKYNCIWLVYYEELDGPNAAIEREKQIKGLTRAKKLALIREMNPTMADLSDDWFEGCSLPDEPL